MTKFAGDLRYAFNCLDLGTKNRGLFKRYYCSSTRWNSYAVCRGPQGPGLCNTERIRIDGNMDEPAWRSGIPIGPLVQVLPKEGDEPSEKTEVRVLVDRDALYFGSVAMTALRQELSRLNSHAMPTWM